MPYAADRSSRLCELPWLLRSRVGVHDHVATFHREEPTFHDLIRSELLLPAPRSRLCRWYIRGRRHAAGRNAWL